MVFLFALPPWPHKVDGGVLLLLAGLFLATVLAHRYWRTKIRLEDELEALELETQRKFHRYRAAFRELPGPAAFVDRVTGLVMETTPGWGQAGLPGPGDPLFLDDPRLEEIWRAIPGPGPDHVPAPPVALAVKGRPVLAKPLGEASLGVVLVVPD